MTNDLARVRDAKTVLLETRKRDGSWIATPVSLVTESGHTYFRTYDASGKAKRLRNFPEVRVTASSLRGKPHGPTATGRTRLLDGDEADRARELLAARFPILHRRLVPWAHKRKGWTTLHYELVTED
ncbi:MAG: PPOX class F420-dependent oxidoreductase [Trebonia sp.]